MRNASSQLDFSLINEFSFSNDYLFKEWLDLYKKNKVKIDNISNCIYRDRMGAVVEVLGYNNKEKFAVIGIGGFFENYVFVDEKDKTLFLNFEYILKQKNVKKDSVTGKIDLSSISVGGPSDGFDIFFENEVFVAVRPRSVGDFYLSEDFVQNLNSCAVRYNVEFRE